MIISYNYITYLISVHICTVLNLVLFTVLYSLRNTTEFIYICEYNVALPKVV